MESLLHESHHSHRPTYDALHSGDDDVSETFKPYVPVRFRDLQGCVLAEVRVNRNAHVFSAVLSAQRDNPEVAWAELSYVVGQSTHDYRSLLGLQVIASRAEKGFLEISVVKLRPSLPRKLRGVRRPPPSE